MITFTFTCLLSTSPRPSPASSQFIINIIDIDILQTPSAAPDPGPGLMTLFKSYHEHGDFISSFLDKLYKFPIITASEAAVIFQTQYIIFVSEIMSLPGPRLAVGAPLCLIYITARICDFHYACDQLRFYLSNSHLYFISCGTQLLLSHSHYHTRVSFQQNY